ncbi:ATP-binding protein [Acinetobacter baumannii]|nr:ATP-binding protein [Acinetobacter baumannii]
MQNFNSSPFSIWNEDTKTLSDGLFFSVPNFCKSKFNSKKCSNYYASIKDKIGIHTCPYGLNSYNESYTNTIFTGIRIKGYYKPCNTPDDFIPAIPFSYFNNSIQRIKKVVLPRVSNEVDENPEYIDFSIHEIRKINDQIKSLCEDISPLNNLEKIKEKTETILACSNLTSTRLNVFDFERNPELINTNNNLKIAFYKKFTKASKCLNSFAKKKKIFIRLNGSSHMQFYGNQIIDFLPYLILENAIKYSPDSQDIDVTFNEMHDSLEIRITSLGPYINENEIKKIFEKKFRGSQAIEIVSDGGGYGLYFAKKICEAHKIKITAKSSLREFTLNKIKYGEFEIKLEYKRT